MSATVGGRIRDLRYRRGMTQEAITTLTAIKDERLLQAALDHIRVTGSVAPN